MKFSFAGSTILSEKKGEHAQRMDRTTLQTRNDWKKNMKKM